MTSQRFDEDALSAEELAGIDQACLDFEKAFREALSPQIECYLGKVGSELQDAALFYLIRLEADLLREEGGRVSLQQYQDRFPQQRELVDLALHGEAEFEVALEVIIGPHRGRRFTFTEHDSFVVGRAACAHFRLPRKDPFFSRVHFLVEVNPPQCRLVDLRSLNGTKVNGNQVDWADLRHGDLIQGGGTVIRVSIRMPEYYDQPAFEPSDGSPQRDKDRPARKEPSLAETQAWGELPEIPGYKLVTSLGRGGMGVVYLASRAADGAHVAVKVIRPACAPSDQEVQRFLREAQILCALRHPNIVSFHQLGRLGQLLYIVMDFVAGSDAGQLVQRHGPLAIGRAVRIICQALEALHYAHQQRYVHRDVKPANLLVSGHQPVEICRLADFGLARVYCESRMSGLTLLGKMGGTLSFMAPEQILDFRNVGPAADQYGAAATLYYLCTGQFVYPVDPNRDERQIINILLSEPVPIGQRRPDIPAGLAQIVHTALAKDPRDRFADVAAFREALLAYQGAPTNG